MKIKLVSLLVVITVLVIGGAYVFRFEKVTLTADESSILKINTATTSVVLSNNTKEQQVGGKELSCITKIINAKGVDFESICSKQKIISETDKFVGIGSKSNLRTLLNLITVLPPSDFKDEITNHTLNITVNASLIADLIQEEQSDDYYVVKTELTIFAKTATQKDFEYVVSLYHKDNQLGIVRDRLETLFMINPSENTRLVPFLIGIVSNPNNSESDRIYRVAVNSLANAGTPPAVDALLERMDAEARIPVSVEGGPNLGIIGYEITKVVNPLAEVSFRQAASGQTKVKMTPDVRSAAIFALIKFPSQETRDLLLLLKNDQDSQVSYAATNALDSIYKRMYRI